MQHSTLPFKMALTPKQFTQMGYKYSLIRFTAPKINEHSVDQYDHNIIRLNEDIFLNDDQIANPQKQKDSSLKHHMFAPSNFR